MPAGTALLPSTPTACLLGLELLGGRQVGRWLALWVHVGRGTARDSLRNGTRRKQNTHLRGRRHRRYRIGLDVQVRVIHIAVCGIGGAFEGDGSWHDIEDGEGRRTCIVEDTRPPSTEKLEMISDCATCTYRGSLRVTCLALGLDLVLSPVFCMPSTT